MAISSLSGGAADKLGNLYEAKWGVFAMLEVLDGRALEIQIEKPGLDKAEFTLRRNDHLEYWQTKRQISGSNNWTIKRLADEGILEFFRLNHDTGSRSVFASGTAAPELKELCAHAKAASDSEQFDEHFLQSGRRDAYKSFKKATYGKDADDAQTLDLLRSIEVQQIIDQSFESILPHLVKPYFEGAAEGVISALCQIYMESCHESLTRKLIQEKMAARGYLAVSEIIARISEKIEATTADYLAGQRSKLIRGQLIKRDAADNIANKIINSANPATILLTSSAGGGKSGCSFQIIEELLKHGMPVLAFRLDTVGVVSSTILLGKEIANLSISPVAAMQHAYPDQPFTIVIDQLDAVSSTSARKAKLFETISALCDEIKALQVRRRIHLMLVCRKFDFEHDFRFKRLLKKDEKPVELARFKDTEVETVINAAGGNYAELNKSQKELLSLPQNLSLMCDTGYNEWNRNFSSQNELFDAYWNAKRKTVEIHQNEYGSQWVKFIRHLAGEISRREELSVPETALDKFPKGLIDLLLSEGVINMTGKRYGFGHETFFDYCYIRTINRDSKSFINRLEDGSQNLFRRSQLRQYLAFQRDEDFGVYLEFIGELLSSEKIRAHLKVLTVEIIASQEGIKNQELELLLPSINSELKHLEEGTESQNKLAARIFDIFQSSRKLFEPADQLGLIEGWVNSTNSKLVDWVVRYLSWQTHANADRVATIAEHKIEEDKTWEKKLLRIISGHDLHKSRKLFDLYLSMLRKGLLDGIENSSDPWSMTYSLGNEAPEWSAELVSTWLDRKIQIHENRDDYGCFRDSNSNGTHNVKESARNAPSVFLKLVLPVILKATEKFQYKPIWDGLPRDRIWTWRTKGRVVDIYESFLIGCEQAIESVSKSQPELLIDIAKELIEHKLYTPNRLLLKVYQCAPERFADEAMKLLAMEPQRFSCGYSDSSYWESRKTIKKCSVHCSDDSFDAIEKATLNYFSGWEKSKDGWKERGHSAYTLTSALDEKRRKLETNTKLLEWENKFGKPERPPKGFRGGFVGSPIPSDKAEKMTHVQWLSAMQKYNTQDRANRFEDFLKGGSVELARVLENKAKENPKFCVELYFLLTEDIHADYYSHLIRGLNGSNLAPETFIEIARKAFPYEDKEIRKATVDLIGSIKLDELPSDCIEYLSDSAVNYPDPDKESWEGEDGYYGGSIVDAGINTVRGRAMEAIRSLIFRAKAHYCSFISTIDLAVKDPSLAVRCCSASAIYAAINYDIDQALKWTKELLDADDRLMGTRYVSDLITCFLPRKHIQIAPIISRMLDSEYDSVRETGGMLACLLKLYNEGENALSEAALNGDLHTQKGACQVANRNILIPECKKWCEYALKKLFHSPHEEIQKKAAHCFWAHWTTDGASLQDYASLITSFVQSPAFLKDPSYLLHALEKSNEGMPDVTLEICEIFIRELSEEARDIRTAKAANESEIGKLVFSVYAQAKDQGLKERALSLIDQMCLEGLRSSWTHLTEFDR